ncbi:putative Rho guanyl nucleotide exchange factor [Penicillium brasilianum]|uniref:Putative Rho guanyl nucleotide exchange factor n=1 Tax=Penicillium brasilianum TaxID=104259 RepID=A0A1S9RCE3_PENBI|nr:putative Rho guanyl nucleotide exchange factor [Penicillium brasilianum]
MSGSGVEQASGVRNPDPPSFGRQSSAPTFSQSACPSSSTFETSPIASSLSNPTYAALRSGLDPAHPLEPGVHSHQAFGGRDSPNPDDFYRSEGVPATTDGLAGIDNVTSGRMAAGYSDLADRVSPLPTNNLDYSRARRPAYRSTSDSSALRGPSASVPPTSRARQPSFKELVNKFNKTSDDVLPLPTISRSTSRAASPSGSLDSDHPSRTLPRRRHLRGESPPPVSATSNPRLPVDPTPSSPELERPGPDPLNREFVIPPPLFQRIPKSHPRRPLFGELLSVNTQLNNLGFGIPTHIQRRGSEGSLPSPSPAFLDQSQPSSARSPLTPTAWYLGQTSSLEAVQTGLNGTSSSHRRARSDLAGNPSREPLADPWTPDMAVSVPLRQTKPGDVSPGSPNSRSRIPVSSHRLPTASGPESQSSISNSTFSSRSSAIPLAPKGSSRLPKPSGKDSPPRMAETGPASFAMTGRGRRDLTIGRSRTQVPERSQLLQAYIAAPPPLKSPPLRSSRPRQPISHGGPMSPRSRIGDRISTLQQRSDPDIEPSRGPRTRPRRLPELGNVDFETRRQRIQQAFTRTVQENERKEEAAAELRRRAREQERAAHGDADTPTDEQATTPSAATANPKNLPSEEMATITQYVSVTADGGKQQRTVPQLHLNTAVEVTESNTPHTTMDSPTLGNPEGIHRESHDTAPGQYHGDDVQPKSAISTGSSDTHVTQFDPEPQSGLLERKPSLSHRTLLNHIMQIRESSSSSDSCDEPDCSLSENDDKASIKIMLRESQYLRSGSSTDTEEPRSAPLPQAETRDQPRWSLSSWDSSVHHNQTSTCDEHCEESGDDAALQDDQAAEPATQSCSAASTSSPSFDENDTTSPIQTDIGLMGPDTVEYTQQQQSSHAFSTPPSLAKQGRWDSRRVTQLYLEELTRGRANNNSGNSNTGNNLSNPPLSTSRTAHFVPPRAHGHGNSLTDDPVLVPRFQELPVADIIPGFHEIPRPEQQRLDGFSPSATLAGPSDWEHASPSIMDWMQIAAEDEAITPGSENDGVAPDGLPTPRLQRAAVELEASRSYDSGLGLSINIQPPVREIAELPADTSCSGKDLHSKPHVLPDAPQLHATHSTESSEDSSFQRLDSAQSRQAADSSATSLSPSAEQSMRAEPRKSPSPEQRRLKKRRHVIKELVDTEYTFGKDMKVVDDIYKGTSSSCLDLSAEDVKILFANSDQIAQFSFNFQDTLKKAARSVYIMPKSQRWSSKRSARQNRSADVADDQNGADGSTSDLEKDRATAIGEAFTLHIPQMEKVYTEYLKNHEAANKKLQILQRNQKVSIWLNECREWASDLTSAWDLDSLLVKPVQRILKYPLLLSELLESTPHDHPDRIHLQTALQEVTDISVRINEMKKRADLVGQVVGRKRNQSDVRAGLSKAFGRRTEKLRQQVGLSEMFQDKEYDYLFQKFGEHFAELHVIKNDVVIYKENTDQAMRQLGAYVGAIEKVVDVVPSSYPELESKWRRFNMAFQEIVTVALPEHLDLITKRVHDPFESIIRLYQGPERVMRKRNKRLPDYARFKAAKDRGDKPDKKTTEQGEQFIALNETLKDELPKLFTLTGKLTEAVMTNLLQLQTVWWSMFQTRMEAHVDAFPDDFSKMINDWSSDYSFAEAQVLSLGVCNGSLLADTINLINFNTSSNVASPRRPSTVNSSSHRPGSMAEDSPKVSADFGVSQLFQSPNMSQSGTSRHRADSSFSGRAPYSDTPDLGRSQLLQQVTNTSVSSSEVRSSTEPFPSLPSLSLDTPFLADVIGASKPENPPTSPTDRYSGFFSSAMPMSDAPNEVEVHRVPKVLPEGAKVLFVAASLYKFDIDRPRSEAGFPYLTYESGAVFDVYGEKGELWLACNQDENTEDLNVSAEELAAMDPGARAITLAEIQRRKTEKEKTLGWIWNKHFVKLA